MCLANGLEMKWRKEKIENIKMNPNNPRVIKGDKFRRLVNSVKTFPEMLEIRPIVVDENNIVLGGNMRLKACIEAGFIEVPIIDAKNLTEEQKKEFIIKDNTQFGEWDNEDLLTNWDVDLLGEWGLDDIKKKPKQEGEIEFSEFLGEANNYIVLKFNNDIDWIAAQTHFNLKAVYSKRANGKPWSKGVGRVVDGAEYLKKLKNG